MKYSLSTAGCILAMVLAACPAVADWSDDFNGGPQQSWTTVDGGLNSTATFTNDRYQLHTEGTTTTAGSLAGYVSGSFTDCVVRGRIQQIGEGEHFLSYLLARATPATVSGYVLGVGSIGGGDVPHLWLGKLTNGVYSTIASLQTQPTFDWTDCQAQFSIIGATLRGKVWDTGDPEPSEWQIEHTDASYASGVGGVMLASYPVLGWNSVQVAFDDVSVVPEPATLGLLALGALALLKRRRMP